MNITVIPTAKDINESDIKDKIVLVIDVLRATSTIVTALDNGAKKILPVLNVQEAIDYKKSAKKIILLSFLNLNSASKIVEYEEDIVIVCAGTNDCFSIDDGVCAGALIYNLRKNNMRKVNDMGLACLTLYENTRHNLHNLISQCHHYKILENIGCQSDLEYCLKQNILNIVPIYKDGYIIKYQ